MVFGDLRSICAREHISSWFKEAPRVLLKRDPTTRTRLFELFRLENLYFFFRTSMSPAHDDDPASCGAYAGAPQSLNYVISALWNNNAKSVYGWTGFRKKDHRPRRLNIFTPTPKLAMADLGLHRTIMKHTRKDDLFQPMTSDQLVI